MKLLTGVLTVFLAMSSWAADVDTEKSTFTWNGKKVTGEHTGQISLKSAKVETDKKGMVQKGEFVMDMSSITVTDLKGEWADKFLNHMKSDDFFNVPEHPTAKLEINQVVGENKSDKKSKGDKKKDKSKVAKGKLTIKGKTHPVSVKFDQKDKTYSGTLTFDRTKFDMKYNSGNFFKDLGDKMINDEVTVAFSVVLK